jgi:uncharacterized membrane protein
MMELNTSGEIVVSIKEKRGLRQRRKSIRQLAESEFKRLKMGNTRDKTGILLFLVLQSKEFTVLADSGIHEKVGDSAWEGIRDLLAGHFKKGLFSEGIIKAVTTMGELLASHFPIKPDDTNELSNKVIIRP